MKVLNIKTDEFKNKLKTGLLWSGETGGQET